MAVGGAKLSVVLFVVWVADMLESGVFNQVGMRKVLAQEGLCNVSVQQFGNDIRKHILEAFSGSPPRERTWKKVRILLRKCWM